MFTGNKPVGRVGVATPDSGEVTLSPTEVKELNEQEAARYDRVWEGSADAWGNGRHGYPSDWPNAFASALKKQIIQRSRPEARRM